jgi:hypothetical protein
MFAARLLWLMGRSLEWDARSSSQMSGGEPGEEIELARFSKMPQQ